MKKYVFTGLVAVSMLTFGLTARADGGTNSDECNINGTEQMDAVVVMNATSNAPAGATGIAKIDSENDDGNETAHIDLKTVGLDPGVYDLSITLQSTGSNVDLGQFTVSSNEDDSTGDGLSIGVQAQTWVACDFGGFTNWGCWTNWSDTNFVSAGIWAKWFGHQGEDSNGTNNPIVTETETDLPAGVNPTDIAEIIVSDMNGNPMLIGNLVTPSQGTVVNISGSVQVTPGNGSSVSGTAQLQSTASKGKWHHQFMLSASGMAARSNFKLEVNGKVCAGAHSTSSGQLTIKRLPGHTPALRSLQVLDAQGNVAASAQF